MQPMNQLSSLNEQKHHSKNKSSLVNNNEDYSQFNPLISRVLFSEHAAKDQMKLENSIKQLEKQTQLLYSKIKNVKIQEQTLETLYLDLQKDEEQLKNDIEINEKINEKISLKIGQRESLESLKLQVDMLKNSDEGKGLLIQKLQYFEERIALQNQEHQRLAGKYDLIKHELDLRIQRAQNYAQKLKGKQLQQFQLHRNGQILKKYEDVEYEFKCNQQIIEKIASKTQKSELTSDQAALILSQVNFNIKVEQTNTNYEEQQNLVKLIEKEAEGMHSSVPEKQSSEEERIVLGIKLQALEDEIFAVRSKMKQTVSKKNFKESIVKRI